MGCYNNGLGSNQKWFIGNIVRDILLSNQDVVDMIGDNVYPIVAPENCEGDFLIYRRMQYTKSSVKMGVYEDNCEVGIVAVSDNYDNSALLASKIDNALTGKHIIDGIRIDINLSDSTENFEDNKYIQTLIFKIK